MRVWTVDQKASRHCLYVRNLIGFLHGGLVSLERPAVLAANHERGSRE
mgnify:CR=1 FL=1